MSLGIYGRMDEKRKNIRIDGSFPVVLNMHNGRTVYGQIKNVSLKGLFITGSDLHVFEEDDLCRFEITLTLIEPTSTVEGIGKIVRKSTKRAMGIKILETDADSLTHLRQILSHNSGDADLIDEEMQSLLTKFSL